LRTCACSTRRKEALERQTATSDLLKVIGRSTFDLQPVFDTLAENAVRLCEARQAFVFRFDGRHLRVAATCKTSDELRRFFEQNPIAPGRATVAGRTVLEGRTLHIHDVRTDPESNWAAHRVDPIRTVLTIPMIRAGQVLGVIGVNRHEVRPFTDNQIGLLETFADQAAIAIENVRLFNETKEALERQTATSEVLKTISRSTFDLNAVLQVLIENATRLAGAHQGFIFRFDGEAARLAFSYNAPDGYKALISENPIRPGRGALVSRVLLERRPVHIPDALADPEFTWKEAQRLGGFRSMFGVPMMREGNLIGVIAIWRTVVQPFTEKQIELVSTFADQAVIAIENVRLFNETKEALERQTATAEILNGHRAVAGGCATRARRGRRKRGAAVRRDRRVDPVGRRKHDAAPCAFRADYPRSAPPGP
jgi:GAF domain-containing protein